MFGHGPGKQQVGHLRGGRMQLCHYAQPSGVKPPHILVLHQKPACHLTAGQRRHRRVGQLRCGQQAQVLFACKHPLGRVTGPGGNDHFGKNLGDFNGGFFVQRHIQRDDATECTGLVTGEGRFIRRQQRRPPGHAAGVGVFDDRTGGASGRGKLCHQFKGGVGVVDVVIRQFLALMLHRRGHPRPPGAIGIKRRPLMRIFAVAQGLRQGSGKGPAARRVLPDCTGHPVADRRIIGGSAGIGGLRQGLAKCQGGIIAVQIQFGQQRAIVGWVHHNRNIGMVFRRRPDHCRATDINVFDHGVVIGPFGQHILERIQVDHQQVDLVDVVVFHRGQMCGVVAHRQQPAMHARVQGFHPAIHHFRKSGHIRHIAHPQASGAQFLRRSAGGQQLNAAFGQ